MEIVVKMKKGVLLLGLAFGVFALNSLNNKKQDFTDASSSTPYFSIDLGPKGIPNTSYEEYLQDSINKTLSFELANMKKQQKLFENSLLETQKQFFNLTKQVENELKAVRWYKKQLRKDYLEMKEEKRKEKKRKRISKSQEYGSKYTIGDRKPEDIPKNTAVLPQTLRG